MPKQRDLDNINLYERCDRCRENIPTKDPIYEYGPDGKEALVCKKCNKELTEEDAL